MGSLEDDLKRINELGGSYEAKFDAKQREMEAAQKAQNVVADGIKSKLNKIETGLTRNMPFQVGIPLGRNSIAYPTRISGQVYLVKTPENRIHLHIASGICGWSIPYTDAPSDLLVMITDQKLSELLHAIEEELKKGLSQ